jgi:hypothetical protein
MSESPIDPSFSGALVALALAYGAEPPGRPGHVDPGAVTPAQACELCRARAQLRAAADSIALTCKLTPAGHATLTAWLETVTTAPKLDTWAETAVRRARAAPNAPVALTISALSSRSGRPERFALEPSAFAWTWTPPSVEGSAEEPAP